VARTVADVVGYPVVSKLTTAAKRLLVGQPFRSDRLSRTLLPKRIALPVFGGILGS